jgi:hypothetical protein
MPAIVFSFAGRFDMLRTGTPRSYGCPAKSFSDTSEIFVSHGLTRDHQGPICSQPCGNLRVHRVIGDLRGHSRAAFRPYPHQIVSSE